MATDFRSLSIPVPGGAGTKVVEDTAIFGSAVSRADVGLKGIIYDFSSDDHHINVIEATPSVIGINGATVRVRVVLRYADKNFDDSYSGNVRVLVLAQVA